MKKDLLLGLLILFILNTSAFAGLNDLKRESGKPVANDPKENKLSDEEISRLSRRAETDNLNYPSLSNKEKNDSENNLKRPKQDYGEHRHTRVYIGAAAIILIIILVVVLVA
jgi:hypothetical protein